MFPLLVIDASTALALVLAEDEGHDAAELIRTIIEQNGQLHVPEFFWYEVCSGLLSAERQGRIDSHATDSVLTGISRLPIVSHACNAEPALGITMKLARKHELTIYDAAYLELALRFQVRLKSYDSHITALRRDYPDVVV